MALRSPAGPDCCGLRFRKRLITGSGPIQIAIANTAARIAKVTLATAILCCPKGITKMTRQNVDMTAETRPMRDSENTMATRKTIAKNSHRISLWLSSWRKNLRKRLAGEWDDGIF